LVDVANAVPLTDETWVDVPWPKRLFLAGAVPNPVVGELSVRFALRGSEPATLELMDLAGRRIAKQEVGSLGIGPHVVSLGEGMSLRPGIYLIRLTQGTRSLSAKAVVIR
jgi:hypothetical protein